MRRRVLDRDLKEKAIVRTREAERELVKRNKYGFNDATREARYREILKELRTEESPALRNRFRRALIRLKQYEKASGPMRLSDRVKFISSVMQEKPTQK